MHAPLCLVFILDQAALAESLLGVLHQHGFDCRWQQVTKEPDYLLALDSSPDVILADYSLCDLEPLRALHVLRERALDIPLIVIGNRIGEEATVQCIKQGAVDYVDQNHLARLGEAVAQALQHRPSRDDPNQQQGQEALRKSEAKYRALFEQIRDPIYISTPDGRLLDFNQATLDLFGYTREELSAVIAADLYHEPAERSVFLAKVNAAGAIFDYKIRMKKKDGTILTCLLSATVHLAPDGTPATYQGYFRDVTAQTHAELALQESEKLYRAVVEDLSEFVVRWKPDGTLTFVNSAYCRYFDQSPEQMVGQSFMPLIIEADRQAFQHSIDELTPDSPLIITVHRVIKPDGRVGWQEWTDRAIFDDAGQLCEYQSVGRDITERKQTEIALQESEQRYRNIIESIPMGMHMYQLAEDGSLIFMGANQSADRILGIQHDKFIGKTLEEAFPPLAETDIPAQYRLVAEQGTPWSDEQIDYSNHEIRGAYEVYAFQSSPGKMVAAFLEITERKRAEIALRISEQKFRSIVEQSLDGIMLMDENEIILDWNAGCERILGLKRSETLGKPGVDIILQLIAEKDKTPELYARLRTYHAVQIATRIARVHRPDGALRIVEETTFPIETDGKRENHLSAAILHDITELAETIDALRKSEERYRALVDHMGEGVIVIDRSGWMQFANEAALQIFGVSALVGHHIEEFTGGAEFTRILAQTDRRKISHSEAVIIRPDGQRRTILVTGVPQVDPGKQPEAILITFGDITARKHMEEALRESEGRYRLLAENSTDMISTHTPEGIYLYVSPSCRTLLGYEPDELLGRSALEFVHPDDLELIRQSLADTLLSARVTPISFRIRRQDGRYLWIETVGGTVQEPPTGAVSQIILTSRDITGRKQAEAAEREQRVLAEALRDTAAALTSTLDPAVVMARILENVGRVVQHDAANIMVVADVTAHALYSRGYTNLRPIRMAPLPLNLGNLRHMIETGGPIVIADTYADPDWQKWPDTRWIRSYAAAPLQVHGVIIGFLNLDSSIPGFFTAAQADRLQAFADQAAIAIENAQLYDELRRRAAGLEQHVTERTAELEQERAQLQAILDAMTEGVVYTSFATRKIAYVNPAFSDLMGYRAAEVAGQIVDVLEMTAQSDEEYQALTQKIRRSLDRQRAWQGETRLRRSDGTELDASVTVAPAIGAVRPALGQVTLIRDIGQEKALQEQKDRFIANAAHELRTPITNLKMRLYLTRRQPEKLAEHLVALESATDHMKTLVENLLDVSRFERGVISLNFQEVLLQELIELVLVEHHIRAEARHIQLTVDMPADPLHLQLDPDRIRQVIDNLLSNAVNYTPEGGRVWVRVQPDSMDTGQYIVIHVSDTGIGIATEALPRVFEPFFRAADNAVKGTGLGLAITKEIVDLHGGMIKVESQVKEGSTFSVWLPV